jgi:hypothetical protein
LPGGFSIEHRFQIGGFTTALLSETDQDLHHVEDVYRAFLTHDDPQVVLRTRYDRLPDLSGWQLVFASGGLWRLFQRSGQWAVELASPASEAGAYETAILSNDFSSGEIIIRPDLRYLPDLPFPLRYPMAEILMVGLLAQGHGLLLHACAAQDEAGGTVFAGVSGAGKSTMARIWLKKSDVTLLSDDRVILRVHDDGLWVYGTPWHGDAHIASPTRAPLRKILVLEHGEENQAVRLAPRQAALALLTRSFPPFWDRNGMEFSLDLLGRVSRTIPCSQLSFLPDDSIIDYVRSLSAT